MHILLHLGWINHSKLKDFFRALPFNDIYSPVLHFTKKDIELSRYLDTDFYENLKKVNEDYDVQIPSFLNFPIEIIPKHDKEYHANPERTGRKRIPELLKSF